MLHEVTRPDGILDARPEKLQYYDVDEGGLLKARRVVQYLAGTAETVRYKKTSRIFAREMMTLIA